MAHTIAFWQENNLVTPEIDIHVNLWKLRNEKREHRNFVDLGFLIKNWKKDSKSLECIFLALPFKINHDCYSSLYDQTKKSYLTIFNDSAIELTHTSDSDCFTLKMVDGKIIKVYDCEITNLEEAPSRTILKIKLPDTITKIETNEDTLIYFRIRLRLDGKTFIKKISPERSYYLPVYNIVDQISLGINEIRGIMDESIQRRLANNSKHLKINKIDYFVARESDANLVSQHKLYKRCRELESKVWRDYVPDDCASFNNVLAYHWQEKGEHGGIQHFGAFARFEYQNDSRRAILSYIAIFLLLGGLSGAIGNLFSESGKILNSLLSNISKILGDVIFPANAIGYVGIFFVLCVAITYFLKGDGNANDTE